MNTYQDALAARFVTAHTKEFRRKNHPLALKGPGQNHLPAWFLGPKAENEELLLELFVDAVRDHAAFRRDFHPEDPAFITSDVRFSPGYVEGVATLRREAQLLRAQLKESVPFFSFRYKGHMNWDTVIPAQVGYVSAMLYNPNNVAVEASPVTTMLEMEVGNDLCRMLGYKVPTGQPQPGEIVPWGHITTDGSVANLEGLWASRNLKYYAPALKAAILAEAALQPARRLPVRVLDGSMQALADLDAWTLLNLKADDLLGLTESLQSQYGITNAVLTAALNNHTVQTLGLVEFHRRNLAEIQALPVGLVPATRHYSWPKGAAILGIGAGNMIPVHVDVQGRMDVGDLRRQLQAHADNRQPVMTVVVVIGSTEESSVDPIADVLALREEFRRKGLEFTIHADAAWGGYFASAIREEPGAALLMSGHLPVLPVMPMSDYVLAQYHALGNADIITVDPHKAGYVPYAAGGLCYRNSAMRNLVAFTAPVVYHNVADPTVGIYGVEGSKSGAAAAAVYLAHRVIRPTKAGYGQLLGQSILTSKRLYAQLVTINDPQLVVTMFHMLPAQKAGEPTEKVQAQIDLIHKQIVGRTNADLINDLYAWALLKELGSDQVITPYIFNFRERDGAINTDVKLANALNQEMFKILSLVPGDNVNDKRLLVTSSAYDEATYGKRFMEALRLRVGFKGGEDQPIAFLISTVMDPWGTEMASGNVLPEIQAALLDAARQALTKMGV